MYYINFFISKRSTAMQCWRLEVHSWCDKSLHTAKRKRFGYDLDFVKNNIITILMWLQIGMKEMNIVPIDPLFVNKVEIIQSEDSPVSIKLFTRNVDLVGFSKLRITEAM